MKINRKLTLRRLFNYFLGGLLIILPIVATIAVILIIFRFLDGLIDTDNLIGKSIPGIGVLIILVIVTFIGFVGESFLTKPILDFLDHIIEKIPGIKIIYSSIKSFTEAFVGDKRKFTKPVAVELKPDLFKLGFLTNEDLSSLEMTELVAVYFPHSYNFSGNLYLVPKDRIRRLPDSVNSVNFMKFIVSGGVTDIEENLNKTKNDKIV